MNLFQNHNKLCEIVQFLTKFANGLYFIEKNIRAC